MRSEPAHNSGQNSRTKPGKAGRVAHQATQPKGEPDVPLPGAMPPRNCVNPSRRSATSHKLPVMGGMPGFTALCKDTLSGATPLQIRSQTTGLAPAQLRELAVTLAQDPDLTVSVITYGNGMQELEVLHTGPPRHTEHTIDQRRFTREPDAAPPWTLSIATRSALEDAAEAIRALLRDAQHGTGLPSCGGGRQFYRRSVGVAPLTAVCRVQRDDQRLPRGPAEIVRREAGSFGRASMNRGMTTLPDLAS